jgi:RNA polymerase sigma-70 factor (ECF subfamily)
MLKAFKRINQFKGDSSYKTYLSRILINTIKDHFKKKKLFTIPIISNITNSKKEKSSYDILLQDETKKEIYRCINELNDDYKEVFILRDVMEYSYDEIADTLNLPLNTVKTRISRARKKVRELIDEEVLLNEK